MQWLRFTASLTYPRCLLLLLVFLYREEVVNPFLHFGDNTAVMKFTITREQLQEGLAAVAAAIPAKTTLPVLANVLVEASKQIGGLRLSGTDLDIAVSTTVPAEVDADGAVTLPAKKLVDIARELPSGPVRVTAAGEARVSIESGRSKFKLLGLPREEFPSFPTVKFEKAWKAAAAWCTSWLVTWRRRVDRGEPPILNGVLWELRPDRMRMVATNGHRLAKMDVPATGGSTADLIVRPRRSSRCAGYTS